MGMRATQSNSVELKGICAAEEQIQRAALDQASIQWLGGIFAYFEILLAATYFGIGKRAVKSGRDRRNVTLYPMMRLMPTIKYLLRIAEG